APGQTGAVSDDAVIHRDQPAASGEPDEHGEPDEQGPAEHDDDVVVLSWWQHPVNVITLVVATALIAGMVGWLVGDATNEVATSDADVGFLQDMRVHHEQAVEMSLTFLGLPDIDPNLVAEARGI